MRLSDLIDGWIIAMQQMHIGDQWEIYIPRNWDTANYLNRESPVALPVFEIELLGVG